MIVPWLSFIAVGLITCAGFVKLAARLLRYSVTWKASFLFAVIMLVAVVFAHVLALGQSARMRIVQGVALLFGLITFGSWFFRERGTDRRGTVLGGGGGSRLMTLTFAMMIVLAFAVVILAVFTKHLSPPAP